MGNLVWKSSPEPQQPQITDTPWRITKGWGHTVRCELKDHIAGLAPQTRDQLDVPFFKIALTGQIGAGKSSTFNSVNSIFHDKFIGGKSEVGITAASLTKEFRVYDINPHPDQTDCNPLPWRICDTPGLDHSLDADYDVTNILKAVDGHILDRFRFPSQEVLQDDLGLKTPKLKDRAHCVAVVIDGSTFDQMEQSMKRKLRNLRQSLITRSKSMGQHLNRLFRSQEGKRQSRARVPWRVTSGWTKEIGDKLKTNIARRSPPKNGPQEIPYINIALTGQIGAGKSSYINSLNSIFQEEVVGSRADVGQRAVSLTEEYRMYTIIPKDESKPLRWRICDTMGLQPQGENDCENILKAIDGHVPDRFKFSRKQINQDTPSYIARPELKDKAHCVAIVINAQGLEQMDDDVKQKLKTLRRKLGAPRTYILLTHIDEACEIVAEHVTNVYHSTAIHDLVRKVGIMLDGLPENQIFPVMNYKKQVELEDAINILLLFPLRQMLSNAQEYLKDQMASLPGHSNTTAIAISQRGQPVMQTSTV